MFDAIYPLLPTLPLRFLHCLPLLLLTFTLLPPSLLLLFCICVWHLQSTFLRLLRSEQAVTLFVLGSGAGYSQSHF